MTIALWIFSVFIGLASTMSAMGKFTKMEQAISNVKAAGVKDSQIAVLGALEIAGAIGLLVGVWVPLLGQAAAICLAIYFIGAIVAHMRAGHEVKVMGPAIFLALLAIATAVFQLAR